MEEKKFKVRMDEVYDAFENENTEACASSATRLIDEVLLEPSPDVDQVLWPALYRHKRFFEDKLDQRDGEGLRVLKALSERMAFPPSMNWRWILSTATEMAYRIKDVAALRYFASRALEACDKEDGAAKVRANLVMFFDNLDLPEEADSYRSSEAVLDKEIAETESEIALALLDMGNDIEEILREGDVESTKECLTSIEEALSLAGNGFTGISVPLKFVERKIALCYIDCLLRERRFTEAQALLVSGSPNETTDETTNETTDETADETSNDALIRRVAQGLQSFLEPGITLSTDWTRWLMYRAFAAIPVQPDQAADLFEKTALSLPEDPSGLEQEIEAWVLAAWKCFLIMSYQGHDRKLRLEVCEKRCQKLGASTSGNSPAKIPTWRPWLDDYKTLLERAEIILRPAP